jgi:PTS system nitrogen regulatory IIA component
MSEEDFDIAELASYLHMLPAQVLKLVERGKLPARRVGGDWRLSRAEVHHWLEDRIGISDDSELAELETSLERSDNQTTDEISIAALIPVEAISIPLAARTRNSVITAMCELAANTGLLWDAAKMADAVVAREAMHPTALDIGVALLHPRRPQASILGEAVVALGITGQGIPFGGSSNLTDIFFLICSTTDHEHLRILARLSRMITDNDWLDSLRGADGARFAHRLISERDNELSA